MKIFMLMKKNEVKKVLILLVSFFIIYGIILTSLITKKYNLKEGDIAKIDIKAPRDVKDRNATNDRINQAVNSVGLQYNKNSQVLDESLSDLNENFATINSVKDTTFDNSKKLDELKSSITANISDADLSAILSLSKDETKNLQQVVIKAIKEIYNGEIREENPEDIKKAKETADAQFKSAKLNKSEYNLAKDIVYSYIKPNMTYDSDKTKEIKEEIAKKVSPVIVKKEQVIVKEGEPVTANEIAILEDLGLLNSKNNYNWYIYISLAMLVSIVLFLEVYYIFKYYKQVYDDSGKLIMVFILNIISIILARTISIISPFLIPLACVPMLLTLLLDYKIALIESILNSILISAVCEFNTEIILLTILSCILVSIVFRKMQQRSDTIYAAMFIAFISAIVAFSVGFLLSNNVVDNVKKAAFTFIGGILSAVLTIGFLPIFENVFGIVTSVKLLELSDPNHPLMKKLLMEAPGTYHHSIMVANLAEVAVEKVGGNPLLARVSAYYHDIGKIKRPYFFKENQIGVDNPHSKINPNLSALVIISHVKDGIELAKEYNIPKIIQNAIEQHHGNTLVKYFYITLKNSSENPDEVKEENFRYPGPVPESKEIAIIMLADSIEAAVRSIHEPTKCKVEEMINNIINERLSDGQLSNCDLTLKDIGEIRKAFLKALLGIYHQRIEYPVDKSELKKQKE
ncbi:HD family phosphohydrolase [Clostridium guangxiense]|uniref:HD family phosphohydrolase n=1 Tax=Clostridium guangxiense TaxID=1662055 RepID=UPI001E56B97D|nr:HD family phosphohydrolase [Clostridium guangxiense]MCD2347517.1 HD family phosphohydrolase [Clostridium guangxiense]